MGCLPLAEHRKHRKQGTQNTGDTRYRTQKTQDTGNMGNTTRTQDRGHWEHRTQTQAGKGQQGAPNPHSSAWRWSLGEGQALKLTFLLVVLLITLFPGICSFLSIVVRVHSGRAEQVLCENSKRTSALAPRPYTLLKKETKSCPESVGIPRRGLWGSRVQRSGACLQVAEAVTTESHLVWHPLICILSS